MEAIMSVEYVYIYKKNIEKIRSKFCLTKKYYLKL